MGNRSSRAKRENPKQKADESGSEVSEGLIDFLSTTSGSTWLADQLLDWPSSVHKLQKASLQEINHFIIARYHAFRASPIGRRMITVPGQRKAAAQDTLVLPIYLVEDFIKQRLRSKITRNWWSIGWFLATRTPAMCGLVFTAKHLFRKHVLKKHEQSESRRVRRLVRGAEFVLDELLPTPFYGPLLTLGLLARRMVHELEDS